MAQWQEVVPLPEDSSETWHRFWEDNAPIVTIVGAILALAACRDLSAAKALLLASLFVTLLMPH